MSSSFGVLGCGEVGWRAQLHNWPRGEYRSVSEDGWRWLGWCQAGTGCGVHTQTPVLYSQLSQSFQTAAPPLPAAAGTTKTENMSPTSIATEAVYSV